MRELEQELGLGLRLGLELDLDFVLWSRDRVGDTSGVNSYSAPQLYAPSPACAVARGRWF